MWLDIAITYLHYVSFALIAACLFAETLLLRSALDVRAIEEIYVADVGYFSGAFLAIATGAVRLGIARNGLMVFGANWVFLLKVFLFFAVAAVSLLPTRRIAHWRTQARRDRAFTVPQAEARATRAIVTGELAVIAALPLLAAMMVRGVGQ